MVTSSIPTYGHLFSLFSFLIFIFFVSRIRDSGPLRVKVCDHSHNADNHDHCWCYGEGWGYSLVSQ